MAHRVDAPGHVANKFVAPDSGTGVPGTDLAKDWHNDMQENVVQAVEAAGLTLVKGTDALPAGYKQLTEAIRILGAGAGSSIGKNLLINGGFDFWQATKNTPPSFDVGDGHVDGQASYFADQWYARLGTNGSLGHGTLTRINLGVGSGAAPRSGAYACEWVQVVAASSPVVAYVEQRVELLEELDLQVVTFSIYAKVASGTTVFTPFVRQNFGTGGSAEVVTDGASTWTFDTTFKRFTMTFTVPSIAGKTVGPGAFTAFGFRSSSTFTARFTAAQSELGDQASAYAVPEYAGELLRCQRFYWKSWNIDTPILTITAIGAKSTDEAGNGLEQIEFQFPVPMRTTPSVTYVSPRTGATGKVERPPGADATVTGIANTGERSSGFPTTGAVGSGIAVAHAIADARL